MKLKDFFLNCLNRRSFQFMPGVGIFIFLLILFFVLCCLFNNSNIGSYYLALTLLSFLTLLPIVGSVFSLTVIIIYIKLVIREFNHNEYRLTHNALTLNPIYGSLLFAFYILAILSMVFISAITIWSLMNADLYPYEILTKSSICFYSFSAYILICVLLIIFI